jgi:hypothetical protein
MPRPDPAQPGTPPRRGVGVFGTSAGELEPHEAASNRTIEAIRRLYGRPMQKILRMRVLMHVQQQKIRKP